MMTIPKFALIDIDIVYTPLWIEIKYFFQLHQCPPLIFFYRLLFPHTGTLVPQK